MNDSEMASLVEDGVTLTEMAELILKLSEEEQRKVAEVLGIPFPFKVFQVGDRVAGSNPSEESYYWHGCIVKIVSSNRCMVDWEERAGMKSGRILFALLCNLRKI
ncbi:hypothetical protein QUB63_02320 [Microcoleus sp. ARI1-B5]|uniref:hypothetical protein n=1 Tax=unclassified Microcoleus TaxID=2642155 RepID=UPI002FD6AD7C